MKKLIYLAFVLIGSFFLAVCNDSKKTLEKARVALRVVSVMNAKQVKRYQKTTIEIDDFLLKQNAGKYEGDYSTGGRAGGETFYSASVFIIHGDVDKLLIGIDSIVKENELDDITTTKTERASEKLKRQI